MKKAGFKKHLENGNKLCNMMKKNKMIFVSEFQPTQKKEEEKEEEEEEKEKEEGEESEGEETEEDYVEEESKEGGETLLSDLDGCDFMHSNFEEEPFFV